MECWFKIGFDNLKEQIISDNTEIKHIINLNNELVFIKGIWKNIDSFDYLFCERIHPAIKTRLKDVDGIYFHEKFIYPQKGLLSYEYIIKIENSEKYHLSCPLILNINEEIKRVKRDVKVNHSGYYGSSEWTGLSFDGCNTGMIGFLPDDYIPMLKGERIRREYRSGRWDKLYGFTEYSISGGDQKTKNFIIEKNNKYYGSNSNNSLERG